MTHRLLGRSLVQVLPTACCSHGTCGSFGAPAVAVGDEISVFSDAPPKVLRVLEDCVENEGLRDFLVPIVPCGGKSHTATVVGFADVLLGTVDPVGPTRGMTLRFACPLDPIPCVP